ncbi:DUF4214 domain-containing protein [Massilia sp. IC2-476]|uniref:DUF4214 domain-containing protein n=1 Tax=Massilia sp. IC2-476 TaxID=2887199 RepID=UPI001D11E41B|nr:DUF4214 domain-containing protein [Massilia sp. IC2-476]MCC2971136.1 DUF4214 domain-containing protein [Massilia sp. IC2-476]
MAFQNAEAIQKLYVAFFNRPADYYGLQYWDGVIAKSGNATAVLSQLAASFAQSKEYTDTYAGQNTRQVINNIYKNLFGRSAEEAGLEYWNNEIAAGRVTLSNAVLMISAGAQNADKTAFASKVTAATSFTDALDTTDERLGYSGEKANAVAKTYIASVTDAATLAAAVAPANLDATVNQSIGAGTTNQTYTLTKGLDVIPGTAGNDRIIASIDDNNAEVNTLSSVDTIDGAAGVDTLVIAAASGTPLTTAALANIKNVEVIEVQAADAVNLNTTGLTGVSAVNVVRAGGAISLTTAATTDIGLNLKASSATTTLLGGKNVNVALSDVTATTGAIQVGSAGQAAAGTVAVATTGAATVAATDVTLAGVTVTGGTSINVTEKATSSAAAAVADTTGATVTQGAVSVTGTAATTTVSVKQDVAQAEFAAVTAVAAKSTTEEIVFGAAKAGDIVKVDFGDGELWFTAKKDLTAAQVASAFANLTRGATQGSASAELGIYTDATGGVTNRWTSGAVETVSATSSKVVFTSTTASADLDVTVATVGGGAATVTAVAQGRVAGVTGVDAAAGQLGIIAGAVTINDAAGSIKTATIDSYGGTSSITGGAVLETLNLSNSGALYDVDGNVTSVASLTVADTASTLALNLNKVGFGTSARAAVTLTAAPTTLNVKSTGSNFVSLTAAATETLNVTGTGTLNNNADLAGLKTVKVSETAGLTLAAATADTLESVDTTATTGTVTVSIQGNKATYAGGAGSDRVTITNGDTAISKSINLGAGNDTLSLSTVLAIDPASTVELNGGEGTDTLALSAATAVARSAGVTFQDRFTGFEKISVGATSTNSTVNMDNLDDINYVISNGSAAGVGAAPTALTPVTTQGNAVGPVTESSVITFNALTAGQSYTVAGRTVTAVTALTAAQVATAFSSTGATIAGTVTVSGTMTGWTPSAASTNDVTFTSTTAGTNVTDIAVSAAGAAVPGTNVLTLDKMLNNATVEFAAQGDVEVKLADASGTADTVNFVTAAGTGVNIGTATADKVETIKINVTDTDTSSTGGVPNVSTNTLNVDADAASTITVGGAGNLTLTLSADTKAVTLIDGSAATGILSITTVASDTAATTVKGGSAADVLTAMGANDVLQGGAGNDVLKVMGGVASAVTLTGGEGVDMFDVSGFVAANAGAAVSITDLTKGEKIKFVSDADADFVSSKVSLIAEATFDNYVTEAAKAADAATADHGIAWFQFNGNTFIVQDVNGDGAFNNGTDIIVKLTGIVDLSAASFNEVGQGTLQYL